MIVSRDHKRMGRSFDEDDDNDDEDDVEELERKIKYIIPVVYLNYLFLYVGCNLLLVIKFFLKIICFAGATQIGV